jgi:hypothetical protein
VVERAVVGYLVRRLDAGNVLGAKALGSHFEVGAIGWELWDKSRSWSLYANFARVASEPSFVALTVVELAELVQSDDMEAKEADIFAVVLAWVKEDEVGRKVELDRLLPLVRFPLMSKPGFSSLVATMPLTSLSGGGASLAAQFSPPATSGYRIDVLRLIIGQERSGDHLLFWQIWSKRTGR